MLRVDPSRVDAVQHVEQINGIGRIRAVAPELDQQRAQIVPIASEPYTGASPIACAAVAIALLYFWPPCGAARHLGVGARLTFRDQRGEQRELVGLGSVGERE